MLTNVTDRNTNTTALHMPVDNSNFSVFSYLKVNAAIGEVVTSNTKSKISKKSIFNRLISIYCHVKDMITPSKEMRKKMKPFALVLAAILAVVMIQALTVGILTPIFLSGTIGFAVGSLLLVPMACINIFISYYLFSNIIINGFSSIRNNKIEDHLLPEPSFDTNQTTDSILRNISHLAPTLDTSNEDDEPDIPNLFQLTHEIQDLSFISGTKHYDNLRETLMLYLKTHPQCFNPLLQYAMEQDKNKLRTMLEDLNGCEHLSLTQMEAYHAALKESTNTPEETPDTQQFKATLARKLLLDLPSINKEIINASNAISRLTMLKRGVLTETTDQPHQTETDKIEDQESQCTIDSLIDRLHYISCFYSLLNNCYPSLHSTQKISQDQCEELTECDKTYQTLRSQLSNLCSNPDGNIPKIWAIEAIARQINRTWVERYRNQQNHHGRAINPVQTGNQSPISRKNLYDADHADNIILFNVDNHLYGLDVLMDCTTQSARQHIRPSTVRPPINSIIDHHMNIIALERIINMEHFTIENILPVALPLDFIEL